MGIMKEKYKNSADKNLKIILEQFENLKGQFIITDGWKIERLIGIGDDTEDWYYLTYNGRELRWNTCVGRIMPLKGKLDDKDYNELVRTAKSNHFDQYYYEHKKELETMSGKDEIVVGLYWEIN